MKQHSFRLSVSFLIVSAFTFSASALPNIPVDTQESLAVGFISVGELKAKVSANAPVTIIDVRATDGYVSSTDRIKGAIHVKLRRLRSRLGHPPLKDLPRDREVVTYCACPSEESSIEAAKILIAGGFKNVRALKGGWQEWRKLGGQVESKPRGM